MGLAASKVCKVPSEDLQEGSIPSTPILAPKIVKKEELDPRSPSIHISRTPLEVLSSLKSEVLEGYSLSANETPAKIDTVLLGIDPRSPTVEFKRTPIIINTAESDVPKKIRNKDLDRVRRSVITTPKSTPKRQVVDKTASKSLESTPYKEKLNVYKRKSYVGLLETNIDYTETDLDVVIREKNKLQANQEIFSEVTTSAHKHFNNIIVEAADPRSPTSDFLRTPIQIIKKITDLNLEDNKIDSTYKSIEKDTKQELIVELDDHNITTKRAQEVCERVHVITNEDTVAPIPVDILTNEDEFSTDAENVETDHNTVAAKIPLQTKSAPITPPAVDGNQKLIESTETKQIKSAPVTPPVDLTADVKELDKKLTSLIYQDQDVVICPRTVKLKDYDSRSPLRNINRNESEKSKSAQKLKTNDKIRKSDYTVSKIPVFKEKIKKTDVQCENMPPRNLEKRKSKIRKSHWDNADTTLII